MEKVREMICEQPYNHGTSLEGEVKRKGKLYQEER